jgi:sucrose-phosphate synthase
LACDIDNTLTGCLEAAADFAVWHRQSAFPFLVATGRDFDAARTILRRWGLPEPDAFIVDVGTRLMLPDGQGGWQECREFSRYLNGGWNREGVVEALRALKLQPQPRATEGPYKISFFGNEADAARIRDALDDHGLSANIVFSHGRLIDVLAPRGGKAEAIAAYARRSGLSLSHCIAAGDSGNDADMLSACGHAIVVGNATEELDGLAERNGSMRVTLPYAAGVLEGLTLLGLYDSETDVVAAAA